MVEWFKLLCLLVVFVVATECFENLSQLSEYSGQATQSESYRYPAKYTADKAVDGYFQEDFGEDTCSITLANPHIRRAWWKFPLKRKANVAYLTIFFRNSTVNRHTGFSVFVFDDSSFTPPYGYGEKVYSHNPSTCPQVEMNITVNKVTQGIALYNSKNPPLDTNCTEYEPTFATIEICEVLVIGCPVKHYGKNCTFCSQRCRDRQCDVFSGSCINGCSNTFMTSSDCSCVKGHYGTICEEACGNCLTGTNCNQYSGICSQGCVENWQGPKCDECEDHKYGPNCVFNCGHCKNNTPCSKIDGTCGNGCESGWSESLCMKMSTEEVNLEQWVMMTPSMITLAGSTLFVVTLAGIGVQLLCRRRKWKRLKKPEDKCSKESDSNEETVRYISARADIARDIHKYNDMSEKEYVNDNILIYENMFLN